MIQNKNKDIFEKLPIGKALWKMALPTIISQIIVLIYNMADTFFIGQLNNPYMVGGASLILPVFNITLAVAAIAGSGGGTLVSRLLGEKNREEAKKVGTFSIYLSIGIALIFSLIMLIFMRPILNLLGASSQTYDYARSYALCVIVAGAIPTVLSNVLSTLLRSEGYSKEAGIGITMGGLINMGLDPLFMFTFFKGQEMVGVGIATLVSNILACIFFIIVIICKKDKSVISFKPKYLGIQSRSLSSIMSVGIPSALSTLLFDLDYVIIDKLMSTYGDIALASIGIVLKVERLPLNVGIGLCLGMIPLVAYNYASGNTERMKAFFKRTLVWGIIFSIISVLVYEPCASYLIQIFIKDSETVRLGTNFLRARVIATPLMFGCFSTCYFFQAIGEGKISLLLAVLRWAAFNIPMLFILNHFIGMYGIVWSQVSADVLSVIMSIVVFVIYRHKHPQTFNKISEKGCLEEE